MWYAQTVDQQRDQRTHLTTPNQQLTVTIHLARVRSVHVLVRLYHAPHTSTLAMHRPSGIRQLLLANRQQPITQGKASWWRSKISACLWQGLQGDGLSPLIWLLVLSSVLRKRDPALQKSSLQLSQSEP
jgi:hypothetical protein